MIQPGQWSVLWQTYTIARLWHDQQLRTTSGPFPLLGALYEVIPALSNEQGGLVRGLARIVADGLIGPILDDQFRQIDRWLAAQGQTIWLMYDELDTVSNDREQRARIVGELLSCWLELQHLSAIKWKFFVREDVWRSVATRLTNASHFTGHDVRLSWQEEDLWRLVLRQATQSSVEYRRVAATRGLTTDNLNETSLSTLQQGITLLCGERMSGSNTAYTYRWILARITDTQDNFFPRSLIILLDEALKLEKRQLPAPPAVSPVIRPSSLQRALSTMSVERVDALGDEYHVPEWLNALRGTETPITREELQERWGLDEVALDDRLKLLTEAGVLKLRERERTTQSSQRYTIAELYRVGIGMKLRGPSGARG
jgi:hypothetical protein